METRVHSFSTKTQSDLDFVSELKLKSRRKGVAFSFVVLQALRAYEASNTPIIPTDKEIEAFHEAQRAQ